jgi:hypothetical protein
MITGSSAPRTVGRPRHGADHDDQRRCDPDAALAEPVKEDIGPDPARGALGTIAKFAFTELTHRAGDNEPPPCMASCILGTLGYLAMIIAVVSHSHALPGRYTKLSKRRTPSSSACCLALIRHVASNPGLSHMHHCMFVGTSIAAIVLVSLLSSHSRESSIALITEALLRKAALKPHEDVPEKGMNVTISILMLIRVLAAMPSDGLARPGNKYHFLCLLLSNANMCSYQSEQLPLQKSLCSSP